MVNEDHLKPGYWEPVRRYIPFTNSYRDCYGPSEGPTHVPQSIPGNCPGCEEWEIFRLKFTVPRRVALTGTTVQCNGYQAKGYPQLSHTPLKTPGECNRCTEAECRRLGVKRTRYVPSLGVNYECWGVGEHLRPWQEGPCPECELHAEIELSATRSRMSFWARHPDLAGQGLGLLLILGLFLIILGLSEGIVWLALIGLLPIILVARIFIKGI